MSARINITYTHLHELALYLLIYCQALSPQPLRCGSKLPQITPSPLQGMFWTLRLAIWK